jgi:hypothetical protein
MDLRETLGGGDLRSKGKSETVVKYIHNQADFDKLFAYLFDADRLIIMRAADAIEKISAINPSYILPHKNALVKLLSNAENKELKWHLAQIISRIKLSKLDIGKVWPVLYNWAANKKESRIVRVHSLQAMYNLLKLHPTLKHDFDLLIEDVSSQNIPSITARIKQFR